MVAATSLMTEGTGKEGFTQKTLSSTWNWTAPPAMLT